MLDQSWSDWANSVEHRLAECDSWFGKDGEAGDLHEVMGIAIAQLRTELRDDINDCRRALDLPIITKAKAKVRVPAGRGRSW
jgi:hypothetical protein